MKSLWVKFTLLLVYLGPLIVVNCDQESESAVDSVKQKLKNSIPMPCYIPTGLLPGPGSFIFVFQLLVCLAIILAPIPKLFFMHNFVTIGLGSFLIAMHVFGIIMGDSLLTQIIAICSAVFCSCSEFSKNVSHVPLFCIGTYMGGYVVGGLLGITSIILLFIVYVCVFGIFTVIRLSWSDLFLISVKTVLCLFSLMVIIDILTPINIISTIHGKGMVFSGLTKWISKLVIFFGGIALFFYNWFLKFYCK